MQDATWDIVHKDGMAWCKVHPLFLITQPVRGIVMRWWIGRVLLLKARLHGDDMKWHPLALVTCIRGETSDFSLYLVDEEEGMLWLTCPDSTWPRRKNGIKTNWWCLLSPIQFTCQSLGRTMWENSSPHQVMMGVHTPNMTESDGWGRTAPSGQIERFIHHSVITNLFLGRVLLWVVLIGIGGMGKGTKSEFLTF